MAECLIFWLFLDSLSISEQIIHTEVQHYDSMKKNIFIDFHRIPKLSIGFNNFRIKAILRQHAISYLCIYSTAQEFFELTRVRIYPGENFKAVIITIITLQWV